MNRGEHCVFPVSLIFYCGNLAAFGDLLRLRLRVHFGKHCEGCFEDGVFPLCAVGFRHVDFAAFGRVDAEFRQVAIGVVDGCCAEPDAPSVGQFGRERHAASASCGVAHDADVRQIFHDGNEIVGCAVCGTVAQHDHRFVPAYAPCAGSI